MSLEPYVSYGCKLCWFSKLDALEADLSGTGLKHWGLNVGFKPFIALGETLDSKLLPGCWSLQWEWSSWQNCVPDSPTNFDDRLLSSSDIHESLSF